MRSIAPRADWEMYGILAFNDVTFASSSALARLESDMGHAKRLPDN
jgi:hypothetical protein